MPYKDPEAAREALRRWRTENPDKQRAINQRAAPREKAYRQANAAYYAGLQRDWRANNPRDVMIINARVRAKKRGIPHTITVKDLEWPVHCPIFGLELDYNTTPPGKRGKGCKRDNFPTLDQKQAGLGYVPGNVFVISYKANRLKQDASIEQLEALLEYMKG